MLGKINDYDLLDILGHGSYGIVYLAESVKKQKFALKLIKMNDKMQKYCISEAQAYVSLKHPNILKARQYFLYKQQTYLVIVLQYCPDGDLSKVIGKINENQCQILMKQIADGLAYVHSKNFTHRDIKPENILLMNGIPKITDFGLIRAMSSTGAQTKIGTPYYMAPEIQFEQKYDQDRKYLADVWSLGIVFFELLMGKRIYEMIEGDKMPCLRQKFPPKDLLNKIANEKLRTLIEQMLQKDTQKRLSSKQVLETLTNKNQSTQQKQPQLTDLRYKISKKDFKQFLDLLLKNYKFTNLTTIDISYSQVTDDAVKTLAAAAEKFTDLSDLRLDGNQITDEGVNALSVAAKYLVNLMEIRLENNQITDKGIKAIAAAAAHFANLTEIHLDGNKITHQGVKSLADVAESFQNLRHIYIFDKKISKQELKKLSSKNDTISKQNSNIPNLTQVAQKQSQKLTIFIEAFNEVLSDTGKIKRNLKPFLAKFEQDQMQQIYNTFDYLYQCLTKPKFELMYKFNAIFVLKVLLDNSNFVLVNWIEIFFLPQLVQIAKFPLGRQNNSKEFFIKQGYTAADNPQVEKFGFNYCLLATQMIQVAAMMKPFKLYEGQFMKSTSDFVLALEQLKKAGFKPPEKMSMYPKPEIVEGMIAKYKKASAQLEQKGNFLQLYGKFSNEKLEEYLTKRHNSQQLKYEISIVQVYQSGDLYLSSQAIQICKGQISKPRSALTFENALAVLHRLMLNADYESFYVLNYEDGLKNVLINVVQCDDAEKGLKRGVKFYAQFGKDSARMYVLLLDYLQKWALFSSGFVNNDENMLKKIVSGFSQTLNLELPQSSNLESEQKMFKQSLSRNKQRNTRLAEQIQKQPSLLKQVLTCIVQSGSKKYK